VRATGRAFSALEEWEHESLMESQLEESLARKRRAEKIEEIFSRHGIDFKTPPAFSLTVTMGMDKLFEIASKLDEIASRS
jgi:hypothetical protein